LKNRLGGQTREAVTNFERFQNLQVELVRAGFESYLHAQPKGDEALVSLHVELREQTADRVETLDALASNHGFSYKIVENSRAAISLNEA
jgi:hypothetical protein